MSAKRIGVDVRALQKGFKSHQGRGIGRYVRCLLESMTAADSAGRLEFLMDDNANLERLSTGGGRRMHRIGAPRWMDSAAGYAVHLRQHLAWPRAIGVLGLDLVHFCSQTDAPAALPSNGVVTVLDLIPHRMAAEYSRGKSAFRFKVARWLERHSLRRARGILTISEYTRTDVIDLTAVDPDRVVVTPLGVNPRLAPAAHAEIEGFRRRHQLAPDYLLYVGGIDRRKNLPFLLECLQAVIASRPETELVLAGRYRDDPDFPALVARIQANGLEPAVRLIGFVPEEELPALYSGAGLFVYPSLYEGFGLPPVEAMACGAPVVAADRTALPEVLGNAAVFADPEDQGEFVEAMLSVLDHPGRARELREGGRRHARGLTWEETARRTLEAYDRFLALPPTSHT